MGESPIVVEEPLLVERFAEVLRVDRLAELLPGDIYPPYLYLAAFLVIDFGIVNTYSHVTGDATYVLLDSPYVVVGPLGLLLAAVGISYLFSNYASAVEGLPLDSLDRDDIAVFERIVPFRVKLVVYGIAVVGVYVNGIVNVGLGNIVATEGAAGLINWLFVWEVGYIPFVVEFGLMYFGVHVLLPRRIANADVTMFFYDPRNMGGFASVGQLLKHSYYLYTAGLLLYFVLTYGSVLFSFGGTVPTKPGVVEAVFFSAAWTIGVASIAYSMMTLHRVMASKKEQRINELEADIEDIIRNPYDINKSEVTDEERLKDIDRRRQEISDTRVYPATFTMWSQIIISVLLPQALNMAVQAVG
ncbi:hypothetical protein [Haloplanus sp.]|uniref:hypothetical protein n=1 Tax=Haloplanus sp. TaxID=1961696 RepID=UPI00260D0B58|nr:hypothetical protein [Haloplanus sp.]